MEPEGMVKAWTTKMRSTMASSTAMPRASRLLLSHEPFCSPVGRGGLPAGRSGPAPMARSSFIAPPRAGT